MICCSLHRYAINLYSGKTAVFYMHKLLLYEVGIEKRQSLNFSRQILIIINSRAPPRYPAFITVAVALLVVLPREGFAVGLVLVLLLARPRELV